MLHKKKLCFAQPSLKEQLSGADKVAVKTMATNSKKTLGKNSSIRAVSVQIVSSMDMTRLDILSAVEETVSALSKMQSFISATTDMVMSLCDNLMKVEPDELLDEDDSSSEALDKAQMAIKQQVELMRVKREAARADGNLVGDHERDVDSAYTETIELAIDLFDALEDFRMMIREHDASVSSSDADDHPVFDNVDELFSYMSQQ